MPTIHITKYALTKGLITCEANINPGLSASVEKKDMPKAMRGRVLNGEFYVAERDFQYDLVEAKRVCEGMRKRAVRCAQRKLYRLEALKF